MNIRVVVLLVVLLALVGGAFAAVKAQPATQARSRAAKVPIPTAKPKAIPIVRPKSTATTPLPPHRPAISQARLEKIEPAKFLFAAEKLPSRGQAQAIGFYPRGCLAGGVELPLNGPTWQVMRVKRNRNWGHPELVRFLERFSRLAAKATGWPGILVGDMAQPRGGPLPFGHASHQVGLDVDIWLTPMPHHRLTDEQRNTMPPLFLVAS